VILLSTHADLLELSDFSRGDEPLHDRDDR
jgi:hypothetical protein